ncbi:hypothetical protein PINS_up023212 [Pythium insidiosum]|nr:hypothetical protein PINS_up023212 [Pythium insidiosum]
MLCVPQRVFMLQVLLLINTLVTSLWDDVPEFVMPEDAEATFIHAHSLTMQAMAKRTTRPIRPHFDRASQASSSLSSSASASSTSPRKSKNSDAQTEVPTTSTSTDADRTNASTSKADQVSASTKDTPVKSTTPEVILHAPGHDDYRSLAALSQQACRFQ